ncbi:MAG: transglycosylase domain-containing protein, partial [Luteimonas sp.]
AWYTLLIETMWPKARILEMYANFAEFGDGVYGAQAAAKTYFGIDAKSLSAAQSARLAAVLPNPKKYKAGRPGPYVQRRIRAIERQMRYIGGASYLRTLD